MAQPAGGSAAAGDTAAAAGAALAAATAAAGAAAGVAAGAGALLPPLLPLRGFSLRHLAGSSKEPDQMPRLAAWAASSSGTYALLYCLQVWIKQFAHR